ncbi:MAG: PPC domain-containing protein, partial [Deltaproteobacteria bacterium]|nr:PPC domain-containing protein [Deltaproteobacteria bacterium]
DDIDAYSSIYDSLLLAYTGGAGNFYLVVESIIYTRQKTNYDLDVDFLKMDEEVEPNDIYTSASALRIPSETKGIIGEPKDGQDENGNPIKVGDVDNYYFYAKAGDFFRFTIIAENGSPASPLDAYLVVYQVIDTPFGPWPVAVNLNDNSKGKDSMVEALISEEGKYYVFVMDSRNTSDNPNPVGGTDYKYILKTEKISLVAKTASSMPYSDNGTLEPAGAYKFYKFSGVKGDKFVIDIYQDSGSDPAFVPFVLLYDASTYQILDGVSGDENDARKKATLSRITAEKKDYMIGILDYNGEGGTAYKYKIDIKKNSLPYYDEKEPNDDLINANDIKENHSLYFGTVDGDGQGSDDLADMYKFSGTVGQVLNVSLYGGVAPEAYDTELYILDSNGNVLADNKDYGNSYYSAIYGWAIPYDGTFYIMVGPQTDYGPVSGSYIMEFELINGCLPSDAVVPQTGELVVNEFYAYAKDDVNIDGTADAGDQFVEIVNPTGKDLLIELVELKVGSQARIKFPCGNIVPAHTAILVFGGGEPNGNFGGSKVFVAKNGHVLPSNIMVMASISLVKGQSEITKVEYNAAEQNENTSFTRDPDITGDFVKHKNASSANGALYSPGVRTDNIPFVDGYAMFEGEPNNDRTNANVIPQNENKVVVFGSLKYEQGAGDNDLDDFFRISLKQGQKLTLVTSAGFEPEVGDTTLILFDANGNELAKNSDISYDNYYSKIADFEIPSDGDYYIDVQAETNYGDLPGTGYRLDITIK